MGDEITVKNSNQSETKWYHGKYLQFRTGLQLPRVVIEEVYLSKRDLIELFYEEPLEEVLRTATAVYGA